MPAYEVSRTLVKSPPEVWSELEKVERLAELLGDGTVEIVTAKTESRIEWRGKRASGTIEISASGWGTKVKLTAEAEEVDAAEVADTHTGEATAAEPAADLAETEQEDATAIEIGPDADSAADRETDLITGPTEEAQHEPHDSLATEPDAGDHAERSEPEERVGFWKRIFGGAPKRATSETAVDAEPEPLGEATGDDDEYSVIETIEKAAGELAAEVVDEPAENADAVPAQAAVSESENEVVDEPVSEAVADHTPETADTEPVDYEALLTGVLDHLGSAHKRPFTHA